MKRFDRNGHVVVVGQQSSIRLRYFALRRFRKYSKPAGIIAKQVQQIVKLWHVSAFLGR
jgi:hypothetical protein